MDRCPGRFTIGRNTTHAFANCTCGHSISLAVDAPRFPQAIIDEIDAHCGVVPIIARTLWTFRKPMKVARSGKIGAIA